MSETTYWLLEGKEAKNKFNQIQEDYKTSLDKYSEACKELGGTGKWLTCGDDITTTIIKFDNNPGTAWKENKEFTGAYRPLKSKKEGKLAFKKLDALQIPSLRKTVSQALLGCSFCVTGRRINQIGWTTFGNKTIIIADRCDQWKPIDGLRILKDSEYWIMKEKDNGKM